MDQLTEPLIFDRIRFICPTCKKAGIINAAWVATTAVKLEGHCLSCGLTSIRSFDLMKIDRWLAGQAQTPF